VRTEDLIVALAGEATPVRPLRPPSHRVLGWVLVSVPVVAAFVLAAGVRPDLAARLQEWGHLGWWCLMAALAIVSAALALATSVPDDRRSPIVGVLPAGLAAVWAATLVTRLLSGPGPALSLAAGDAHFVCALQIVFMAIVPGLVLLLMTRHGASTGPRSTGVLTLAAAGAAGACGASLICPIDRGMHHLLWHFLPVVSLAALGALAGGYWLDRFRR
jgi:hypothetical protein